VDSSPSFLIHSYLGKRAIEVLDSNINPRIFNMQAAVGCISLELELVPFESFKRTQ